MLEPPPPPPPPIPPLIFVQSEAGPETFEEDDNKFQQRVILKPNQGSPRRRSPYARYSPYQLYQPQRDRHYHSHASASQAATQPSGSDGPHACRQPPATTSLHSQHSAYLRLPESQDGCATGVTVSPRNVWIPRRCSPNALENRPLSPIQRMQERHLQQPYLHHQLHSPVSPTHPHHQQAAYRHNNRSAFLSREGVSSHSEEGRLFEQDDHGGHDSTVGGRGPATAAAPGGSRISLDYLSRRRVSVIEPSTSAGSSSPGNVRPHCSSSSCWTACLMQQQRHQPQQRRHFSGGNSGSETDLDSRIAMAETSQLYSSSTNPLLDSGHKSSPPLLDQHRRTRCDSPSSPISSPQSGGSRFFPTQIPPRDANSLPNPCSFFQRSLIDQLGRQHRHGDDETASPFLRTDNNPNLGATSFSVSPSDEYLRRSKELLRRHRNPSSSGNGEPPSMRPLQSATPVKEEIQSSYPVATADSPTDPDLLRRRRPSSPAELWHPAATAVNGSREQRLSQHSRSYKELFHNQLSEQRRGPNLPASPPNEFLSHISPPEVTKVSLEPSSSSKEADQDLSCDTSPSRLGQPAALASAKQRQSSVIVRHQSQPIKSEPETGPLQPPPATGGDLASLAAESHSSNPPPPPHLFDSKHFQRSWLNLHAAARMRLVQQAAAAGGTGALQTAGGSGGGPIRLGPLMGGFSHPYFRSPHFPRFPGFDGPTTCSSTSSLNRTHCMDQPDEQWKQRHEPLPPPPPPPQGGGNGHQKSTRGIDSDEQQRSKGEVSSSSRDEARDLEDEEDEDEGGGQAKGKRGRPRKHAPKIPLPPLYVFIR